MSICERRSRLENACLIENAILIAIDAEPQSEFPKMGSGQSENVVPMARFFFGRKAVRPFLFRAGAPRGMSSNIDAIGTSRTRQISYSRAALIRLMPFSYF